MLDDFPDHTITVPMSLAPLTPYYMGLIAADKQLVTSSQILTDWSLQYFLPASTKSKFFTRFAISVFGDEGRVNFERCDSSYEQ